MSESYGFVLGFWILWGQFSVHKSLAGQISRVTDLTIQNVPKLDAENVEQSMNGA